MEFLETLILQCVEEELRFKTDAITNKGWQFIENKAPEIVSERVLREIKEGDIEKDDINKSLINVYFQEALNSCEYKLREE